MRGTTLIAISKRCSCLWRIKECFGRSLSICLKLVSKYSVWNPSRKVILSMNQHSIKWRKGWRGSSRWKTSKNKRRQKLNCSKRMKKSLIQRGVLRRIKVKKMKNQLERKSRLSKKMINLVKKRRRKRRNQWKRRKNQHKRRRNQRKKRRKRRRKVDLKRKIEVKRKRLKNELKY